MEQKYAMGHGLIGGRSAGRIGGEEQMAATQDVATAQRYQQQQQIAATRYHALERSIGLHGSSASHEAIIATAKAFEAYLLGEGETKVA